MLNDRQLKIAELLFKHMDDKNGKTNVEDSKKYLTDKGFNENEISLVMSFLINHYKLIEYHSVNLYGNTEFHIRITPEGNKAIKWGIEKYIKKKERNSNQKTIRISIIALVIASIQPGIALYNLIFPENKTENRNYESDYRQNPTDSIVKQVLSNETFIEILKDSLKHDTEFLNELKLELKRNTTEKQITTP